MKNILVTGAAGFIGSNFVALMVKRYPNINIVSLDKLTYAGDLNNLAPVSEVKNHYFIEGDIRDKILVSDILRQYKIETVVHFAAESHVDNSISCPEIFLQTNIIGTFTLLEAAKNYWLEENKWNALQCRFHHISTDEVYGSLEKEDSAFTEHSIYQPNSPYSASKASSDHIVRAYYHTYGLPVTTSNCSNNYGPNQHSEKLIPKVILACINKQPIPIYGTGTNSRDWLFVEDHCDAIDLILNKGREGQVYNIGGNNEWDNISLIKRICKIMNDLIPTNAPHESLITFVEDRKGHDKRYAIDNGKIKSELSWFPKSDFFAELRNIALQLIVKAEKVEFLN